MDRRRVSLRGFQRMVLRLQPVRRPLERISRPRLEWLFGQPCERILGAFLFLVVFALFLPIPLSGFIPAFALFITGVGLAEREGAIPLLGMSIGLAAIELSVAPGLPIATVVDVATCFPLTIDPSNAQQPAPRPP